MDQSSFDQIIELLTRNERNVSELRQSLDTLTHKVDFLVGQSITRSQPGVCSLVAQSRLYNDLLIPIPSGRDLEPCGSRPWRPVISDGNIVWESIRYVSTSYDT